jgi:hypothetical protein
LLLGAARQLHIALRHLGGGDADLLGADTDSRDELDETRLHRREVSHQARPVVFPYGRPDREVALRDAPGREDRIGGLAAEHAQDRAADPPAEREADHRDGGDRPERDPLRTAAAFGRSLGERRPALGDPVRRIAEQTDRLAIDAANCRVALVVREVGRLERVEPLPVAPPISACALRKASISSCAVGSSRSDNRAVAPLSTAFSRFLESVPVTFQLCRVLASQQHVLPLLDCSLKWASISRIARSCLNAPASSTS